MRWRSISWGPNFLGNTALGHFKGQGQVSWDSKKRKNSSLRKGPHSVSNALRVLNVKPVETSCYTNPILRSHRT